jgi:hypothetical protein
MAEGTFESTLPCGGTLRIFKSNWEIRYYFPGPDRRYNGTFVTIPGNLIEQYIAAYEDNWEEYQQLKRTIPAGGEFSKPAKMGMSIRIGGFFQGVCLKSYHMPVASRGHLDRILDGYREATRRVNEVQTSLIASVAKPVETLIPPLVQPDGVTRTETLSLEERWERSRAEAKAVTEAKAKGLINVQVKAVAETVNKPFDPYASQRNKRGRKSHLAAAINQNIHDNPGMGCVWFAVFVVLIVGSFVLAIAK